jgi:hypothetical protein
MSHYRTLVQRLREDAELRAALEAAATPDARLAALRAAGLEPPTTDDILAGVAGGQNTTVCFCHTEKNA